MGLRRAGTGSAAGALAFMAIAVGPSSAQTRDECELGGLLCGVLRSLPGQGTPSPTPSPGRSSPPEPRPGPDTDHGRLDAPRHRAHLPPLNDHASPIRLRRNPPELPDISRQAPVVLPRPSATAEPRTALLTSASGPANGAIPPFPVAAASGIIGALAVVHLNVLARRLRRR
jgi:hypothetical protein